MRAYEFAAEKHKGQFRKDGITPYFIHVETVGKTLEKLLQKSQLINAGYLHDTLEDTDTTVEELERVFGKEVASLVKEVTIDEEERDTYPGKKEYILDRMLEMSSDALTLKLVDRLTNIKDLKNQKDLHFRDKYIEGTLFILNNFQRIKENKSEDLTDIQKDLIQQIEAEIDYYRTIESV